MVTFTFTSFITSIPTILVIITSTFPGFCGGKTELLALSKGCEQNRLPEGIVTDKLIRRHLTVNDPRLNYPVEREFLVRVPGESSTRSHRTSEARQLMIYFHGFMGNAWDVATKYEYSLMSRLRGTIMVYPEGLSDYYFPNGTQLSFYQGWSAVGSSESNQQNCQVELDSCGYNSCKSIGVCSSCAFATCSNDTLFVHTLLNWLFDNLCIDTSNVVATGLSNGGLMTYELITKMPDPFRAFIAVYGAPMQGFLNFSNPAIKGKPLLHIHGHSDNWIPFDGTYSTINNVKFEPSPKVVEQYALVQGCSAKTERWLTPFDTINNFTCSKYLDCPLEPNVVLCTYSGGHTYPPMIEEATFLFLDQVDEFLEDSSKSSSKRTFSNPLAIFIHSLLTLRLYASFYCPNFA